MNSMSLDQHLLRISLTLFLGCFCLSDAWAGGGPKTASDYGSSSSQNTLCPGSPFVQDGVTATCYTGSGGFPDSFLFNFTVGSASTTVNSFTIGDLGSGFSDVGLLYDCSSSTSSGDPVPCDPTSSSTLPFSVSGSVTAGPETFDFTEFTGVQTGNVTVVLDCAVGSVCSQPAITAISAGTTATPEPRFYAFLTLAILLGAGLFRRLASANNAS